MIVWQLRYFEHTGAKKIHADRDRVLISDQESRRWLVCTDGSTGRVYTIRVPNDVRTCRSAH